MMTTNKYSNFFMPKTWRLFEYKSNRVLVTWKSGKPVSERETSNATVEIPYHRVVTNLCCTSDEINDGARG